MENMPLYPRTVVLEDAKLTRLVKEKGEMILDGRKLSEDIDALQAEMDVINDEMIKAEKSADVSEFKAEAEVLTKEFNTVSQKMKELNEKARQKMIAAVPQELKDRYDDKKKAKDDLENKRNKVALRVQKWNDKIIPLARKIMAAFLQDEFEDYDTLRMENGKVVGTIFNHLEDFKKQFFANKKK